MFKTEQFFLENTVGGEVYAADISPTEGIIGIYGPIHFTGIKKQFLGKYGTGLEDVEWARQKIWKLVRLDEVK
jgi:hypothetical protein